MFRFFDQSVRATLAIVVTLLVASLLFEYTAAGVYFAKHKLAREGKLPPELMVNTPPELSARGFISVLYITGGKPIVLLERNSEESFLIASITKLMTALVAKEKLSNGDIITITPAALNGKAVSGKLLLDERYTFEELLHPLLIESNNDAARAISNAVGTTTFIARMNEKAKELGLGTAQFANESGLDPYVYEDPVNKASPKDIAALAAYFYQTSPELAAITLTPDYIVRNANGLARFLATSTDALLLETTPLRILAGKTGETPRARQNLVLVTEAPRRDGYIVHVVLSSTNRFDDMRKLLTWIKESYDWETL